VRYDFQSLINMVIDEQGIYEHEDRLRDSKAILKFALGLGFKMLDAIICNITDGTSSKGRDLGNFDILVKG